MADTRTIVKPRPQAKDPAPKPSRRIILLSGEWRSYRQFFRLEATIFVSPDGGASGDIFWINVDTPTSPPDLKGSEYVRGGARGMQLEFQGYYADPGLARDQYSIMLCGSPQSGPFVGTSVTFGWGGELSGTYHIVEQQD